MKRLSPGLCPQWRDSFQTFADDVGPTQDGMQLKILDRSKRIDPKNIQWIYRSYRKRLTLHGETLSIGQWAARIGVTRQALERRLRRMSVTDALSMRKQQGGPIRDLKGVIRDTR